MTLPARIKNSVLGNSPLPRMAEYAKEESRVLTGRLVVAFHYFFLLYVSVLLFSAWDLSFATQARITFVPPIFWLQFVSFPVGFALIRTAFVVASLLAAFAPQRRLFRILSFITLLEFVSLYYSALWLDVDWYGIVLVSFLFIFMPDRWNAPQRDTPLSREKFLLVFWGCQAIVLLTYSMSGIGKLWGAAKQIMAGQISIFDPASPGLQVADRLLTSEALTPLGHAVVKYSALAWPLYMGMIYLLLFSFLVAFKPKLHRLWGAGLILFHIANYLVIDIGFSAHILNAALLMLLSPFAPARVSFRDAMRELPLVDLFAKKR